jgi:hypothetical protein
LKGVKSLHFNISTNNVINAKVANVLQYIQALYQGLLVGIFLNNKKIHAIKKMAI